MSVNGARICKRCLIREMADHAEFQNMMDYIAQLDEEIKTPKIEYEARLEICRGCEMLLAGMCRSCGCYVEMRAAVSANTCPRKKWKEGV